MRWRLAARGAARQAAPHARRKCHGRLWVGSLKMSPSDRKIVDVPSIDRLFDEGKLTNHRIFWKVKQGSFETNAATRVTSTITELVYVPDEVADGEYLLNLQIAPFESDAAPSRPILFSLT